MARGRRKVLRVGAVRDGRIVADRLVELDQPVVLGVDEGLDFSPGSGPWTLFAPSGRRQHALRFTEDVQGRVRRGEEILDLSTLRADPYEARTGQGWALQLDGSERGRLVVGEHVVLFHYVEVGRRPVRPYRPADFRPPVLEPGDTTFVGFLAVCAALATTMVGWVAVTEPAPVQQVPEISNHVREMVFQLPAAPEPVEVADEGPPQRLEDATPAPEPERSEEMAGPAEPMSHEEALVQVNQTAMIQWIGHRGDAPEGSLRVLSGDDSFGSGDLDVMVGRMERLATLEGPRWTNRGSQGVDIDIDDLGRVGAGEAVLGARPDVKGPVIVSDLDEVELDVGADEDRVAVVVRGRSGALRYCYEKRLKEIPGLSGRVEVVWNISGGKVRGVQLVGDTTGDELLVNCVMSSIETWRFPPSVSGEVTWPFVFRPSGG